jgi:hypothetical protein
MRGNDRGGGGGGWGKEGFCLQIRHGWEQEGTMMTGRKAMVSESIVFFAYFVYVPEPHTTNTVITIIIRENYQENA